jgi:D-glycero-D-manno-heptose 1,7-bisphosphate phosphatase
VDKKALFLDRDGVICRMVNYEGKYDSVQRIEDVALTLGIVQIIKWLNEKNILVVEISNQPGIAKGKMTWEESNSIENKVHELLNKEGAKVDYKYICHHHPQGIIDTFARECECRKPKPGLLLGAINNLNINVSKSLFIGDKATDALAGKNADIKTALYIHEEDEQQKIADAKSADCIYKSSSLNKIFEFVKNYFDEFAG